MFLLGTKLTLAYQEKLDTEQKIQSMQAFLKEWEAKNDKLNKFPSKPVRVDQVDSIQTNLIFQIQQRNLELKGIKDSQKKDTDGRVFEVEIAGDYAKTLDFLDYLQNNEVLISIKSFNTQKKSQQLNTKIMYKIYTSGGKKK